MAGDRDNSQRTEEPTQKRLDEARSNGDVVKSMEVTTFAVLAGGTLAIAAYGRNVAETFAAKFRIFLENPDRIATDSGSIMALFKSVVLQLGLLLAPVIAVLIVCALAGHILQARPVFAPEKIKPDLGKLSLTKGFSRMFGLEGLSNLLKGVVKLCIVGVVVSMTLWPMRGTLGALLDQNPASIASYMQSIVMRVMVPVLSVLGVLAALDYFLQRFRFLARNRMTKQEIKEEFRQTEGDPAVKAKIRQLRLERSRRRMMAEVPKATVVVTNPTHFAVALKYESGKMAAPVCVAKGVDALALRIREVAEEHAVPIVENPPLARALFAAVELGETIPADHYKAVAQVIGYVMRLTGKAQR